MWKREHVKEKGDGKKNDTENTAAVIDGDMGIVYDDRSINLTSHTSNWVINLGASFHVTAHRDYFTSSTNGDSGHVWMGNKGASKIVVMEDICFKISVGCKLLLKDVRHVLNIHLNLISTGKLDDDSYTNQFDEGKWKLTKGSLVLAKGKKMNTLYVIEVKIKQEDVNVVVKDSDIETWLKGLVTLVRKS